MTNPLTTIARRVRNVFQAARTTAQPVDTGSVQTVQLRTQESMLRDGVPVIYHYGYTTNPPVGSDAVILNIAGDSTNGVVIGTAHKASRPKGLLPGQTLIYTADGDTILLAGNSGDGQGNGIVITPNGNNGTVLINGALTVTGNITTQSDLFVGESAVVQGVVEAMQDVYGGGVSLQTHTHTGVTAGSDTSGAPTQ